MRIPPSVAAAHPTVGDACWEDREIVLLRATWSERPDLPGIRLPCAGGWLSVTIHHEWERLDYDPRPGLMTPRDRAWATLYAYRMQHLIAHFTDWADLIGDRTVWVSERDGSLDWVEANAAPE